METKTLISYTDKLIKYLITKQVTHYSSYWSEEKYLFNIFTINNHSIYLDIFFDCEDITTDDKVEVVVNIYHDKKQVLAYGGSWDNVIKQIEEHINTPHLS